MNGNFIVNDADAYRIVFENSAVAITVADHDGKIILWNKFAESLFGVEEGGLRGKSVESLYPAQEWERMKRENIRQKGMQHHFETKIARKDGRLVDIDVSISVLKDASGNLTGSIGVMRDITERRVAEAVIRRAKEAAEQANRNKGAFLYELSCQAVKPIARISELLSALTTDGDLNPKQAKSLSEVKESADSLKAMLDDIYQVFQELKEEKFLKIDHPG